MKTIKYIITLMLCSSINVIAQSIPEGYKLLGEVSVNDSEEPQNIFVSRDGKIAAIEFGTKNSVIQIYDIDNWKKLGEFKAKGWSYMFEGFLDKSNDKVIYIGARGNKRHRYDFENDNYTIVNFKRIKHAVDIDYSTVGFASTSYHNGVTMYMLPEQFIITCNHQTAKIYAWESLVANE